MDLKQIKNKLQTLQTSNTTKEKVDFTKVLWKPKSEGKYLIRIVPSKLFPKEQFQEAFLHYGISKFPIYALTNWGEKDPIVEFAKKLRASDEKENWALAKKLDPKMRVFVPIIVRGEEDKGVRLWEFGKEIYNDLLLIANDEDYGDYTDVEDGRDFTLDVVKAEVGGRPGLKTTIRIKPKQTPLSDNSKLVKEWLNTQPDLLSVQRKYSFDDLKEILQNFLTPTNDDGTGEDEIESESHVDNSKEQTKSSKQTPQPKSSKNNAEKFDALFEGEDDGDKLPWESED